MLSFVVCTDDNYIQHATVMLVSLLNVLEENSLFNIFVFLSPDCREVNIRKCQSSLNRFRKTNVKINFINIPEEKRHKFPVKKDYLTSSIYDKLIIFELLPTEVKKVVFIDSDVVLLNDPSLLFGIDLQENVLGAVQDYYEKFSPELKRALQLKDTNSYFNSGVMLVDIPKWKALQISEISLEFIRNNLSIISCYDQDGMNYAVQGNWYRFSKSWNPRPFNEVKLKNGLELTVSKYCFYKMGLANLVHYSGADKPWHYLSNHPMKSLYWNYLKKTDFMRYKYAPYTSKDVLNKYSKLLILNLSYFKERARLFLNQVL